MRGMLLTLALGCAGAPEPSPEAAGDSAAADDGVVDLTISLAPPASGLQLVTDPIEVPPYTEVDICSVVRVESDQVLQWADRMETLVSPGSHHMNVFMGQFSFLDPFLGDGAAEAALGVPIGQYDCSDLSVMGSAFPIFPSQRENQQITFPDGVAAPVLAPALLLFSHHYVNAGPDTLRINAALNIETVPEAEVEQMAALVFDAIGDLEIPPGEERVVTRTCAVERDVEVALVSTHTHEWATCTTLHDYDGEAVEEAPFFVNQAWETPPILHFEAGTFPLSAGQGVHYACHYANTTDRTLVADGTSQGEMCVFAAVMYPGPFTPAEVGEIVETGDLAGLSALMSQAIGPCDSTVEAVSPWAEGGTCEGLPQTESNTLE